MMFVQEALLYGLREGFKLGALYMVWSGISMHKERATGFMALLVGVAVAFLLFISMSFVETGMEARQWSYSFSGYVFFIFFFAASIVLLRFPDMDMGRPGASWSFRAHIIVFLSTCLYFAPEAFVAAIYLGDLADLSQNAPGVYVSLALGAAPVLMAMYVLSRYWSRRIGGYFGLPQLLIFLVLLKLLLSGAMDLAEFSLVPAVQRGVMKFVHDLLHQSFLYLLVPDHAMLKASTWNFIGFFFGPDFSIALALGLLLVPSVFYLYHSLTAPVSFPEAAETGADRRLVRAGARHERLRKMAPVAFFVLIVVMSWYASGSEKAISLYVPEPKPLIEDNGMVVIPLTSPGTDLMDGRIHKFSVLVEGKSVRLLLARKPDGTLAVTLDACEICPPDGYGQRDSSVVCIYCMTPMPLDTLGRPGGCNPIPLASSVTERDVRITIEEIGRKWDLLVNSPDRGMR
jgi:hypothetical protein